MDLTAEVLAKEIDKESDDYNTEVMDSNTISVVVYHTPGMFYPEYFETYIENIRIFIMQHTKDWKIIRSSLNRIEGRGVIVLSDE